MDIISFGLGISSMVVIILILVAMYTIVKVGELKEKVNSIETDYSARFEDILRTIDQNCELDNRRIDGEIDRTNTMVDGIYRTIDSRLDKLEVKLTENKSKKLIKE